MKKLYVAVALCTFAAPAFAGHDNLGGPLMGYKAQQESAQPKQAELPLAKGAKVVSQEAKDKIEALHHAFGEGDKEAVAEALCYPVTVNYQAGAKTASKKIVGKKALLASYDKIFSKEFTDAATAHSWTPESRPHGIMVLNGVVWTHENGCAKTICTTKKCQASLAKLKD